MMDSVTHLLCWLNCTVHLGFGTCFVFPKVPKRKRKTDTGSISQIRCSGGSTIRFNVVSSQATDMYKKDNLVCSEWRATTLKLQDPTSNSQVEGYRLQKHF